MTTQQALQMALWSFFVPMVWSLGVYLALYRSRSEVGSPARLVIGGLAGLVAPYLVCHSVMMGMEWLPPREALQWLPWAAVLGAAAGCAELAWPNLRHKAAVMVLLLVMGIVLPRVLNLSGRTAWIGQALTLWALLWTSLRIVTSAPTRLVGLSVLGLLAAFAGAALAGSGSLKLGQLAGVVGSCAGGVFLLQIFRPSVSIAGPGVGAASAVVASALAQGVSFGSTPAYTAFVFAGTALAAIPAVTWGATKDQSWKRLAIVWGVMLLGCGTALFLAVRNSSNDY